jgi:tyrosyl-tRNA synthetase
LDLEERCTLATRNAEEVITEGEIREILEAENYPKAYWGFELSGMMHIGMGLVCGSKIKDLIRAGFDFTIFLADWHSWINNKLGGDMNNIRICGEYFRHCFNGLGISSSNVKYVWASELARDMDYWEKVIRVAKSNTIHRVWRALPIMGREIDDLDVEAAALYYPCMQVADIFQLGIRVACAGMDQRKAHMLARDSAQKLGFQKPSCIHTHLLMSLAGQTGSLGRFDENAELSAQIGSKMSKSKPQTCIFVHDSPEEIKSKLSSAYCPPKEVRGNPILEIAKYAVFTEVRELEINRPPKYGGPITFRRYNELEEAYRKGEVHPLDLKVSLAEALSSLLEGVRREFSQYPQMLMQMQKVEITR